MRLSHTDALTLLREALATLPSDLDARSDFFVQWRTRTIQNLELIFPEDPAVATAFKQIDFSPRRLTKNETRDAQLRLDAFLSGCVVARAHLEEAIRRLLAEPELPRVVLSESVPETHEPAKLAIKEKTPTPVPPQTVAATDSPEPFADAVIKGAHMSSHELCAPVRSSLSRVLGAWERGDREAALVLSAQLLADLTVLSRDDQFRHAFDGVVSKFVGSDGVPGALDSLQAAAPLCVWSMMAAINEVMK